MEGDDMLHHRLDKSQFVRKLRLLAIRVPQNKVGLFVQRLRGDVLNMRRVKSVVDDPTQQHGHDQQQEHRSHRSQSQYKLLLLDPRYRSTDLSEMSSERRRWVWEQLHRTAADAAAPAAPHGHSKDEVSPPPPPPAYHHHHHCQEEHGQVLPYELTLTYDDMTAEEVLRAVLPADAEVPSSFESVGHIAHMNIRDQLMPYRFVIGRVILDKNRSIRTVVNKLGVIESHFREFKMELLAGEEDFDVQVKEHGCTFRFNYREVYWNSRLSSEHQRVLRFFRREDTVCDMFAGVGPFAVPAAKRVRCRVLANDLNPRSFHYMAQNVALNRVAHLVQCTNMDGREFVRQLVERGQAFHHVLMNLPGSATDFLDVFADLYRGRPHLPLPMVHCYTFVAKHGSSSSSNSTDATDAAGAGLGGGGHEEEEGGDGSSDTPPPPPPQAEQLAKESVALALGLPRAAAADGTIDFVDVHNVRNVAPTKDMFCVSFRLPQCVAYGKRSSTHTAEEGEAQQRRQGSSSISSISISSISREGARNIKRPRHTDG